MTTKKFVFDFGGVLFHWQPAELLRRELPQHAADDASALRLKDLFFQGYVGDWGEFDRGTIEVEPLARRIAARTGLALGDVQRVIGAVPQALTPLAASVDLLSRLRRGGQPMYYLSNMPAPYADHLERTHHFVGWFAAGVFSARVRLIKPEREIFDHAVRHFGAAPHELVFLDDHPANVDAARAAGWQALHFTDARACEVELKRRGWWPDAA